MRAFYKSLQWLEPVIELARMAVFLAFLALVVACIFAIVRRRGHDVIRRRANGLIAYVVAVSCFAGVFQLDAWPFTNWALVHTIRQTKMNGWELQAVDASGRTWQIDKRMLQPWAPEEFGSWLHHLETMPLGARENVMRFLLDRAEHARQQVRAGERFPPNDWLLSRASAPYHFQEPGGEWRTPNDVPDVPFVSLRIIAEEWDIEDRYRNGDKAIKRRVYAASRTGA